MNESQSKISKDHLLYSAVKKISSLVTNISQGINEQIKKSFSYDSEDLKRKTAAHFNFPSPKLQMEMDFSKK